MKIKKIKTMNTKMRTKMEKIILMKIIKPLKDEYYHSLLVDEIIYTYQIIDNTKTKDEKPITNKINRIKLSDNINVINFKGYNLPNTMDYYDWGNIIEETENYVLIKRHNSKLFYYINIFDNYYNIQLKLKDIIILEYKDQILEKGKLDSFIRTIKNQEYIFIDGELKLKKIIKQPKILKKILPDSFIKTKI